MMQFLALLRPGRPRSEIRWRIVPLELVGAVRHLVALLRKHFSAYGNPPVPALWEFESSVKIVDKKNGKAAANREAIDYAFKIGESDALYFSSLLITPLEPPLAEAARFVPAVREAASALATVRKWIDKSGQETARLQHLFRELLDRQWSETLSLTLQWEAGKVVAERFGYALEPVDEQLLVNLLDAADELQGIPETPDLTEKEETVLTAMAGDILSGRQIAEKAGYEYNSSFRSYLSQMTKRHLIVKVKGRSGYKRQ